MYHICPISFDSHEEILVICLCTEECIFQILDLIGLISSGTVSSYRSIILWRDDLIHLFEYSWICLWVGRVVVCRHKKK